MCLTPRCETASITALWIAGVDPMVPDSPMPLAPIGLRGRRCLGVRRLERRQLGRRRHRVVGEVARDRVAVGVVRDDLVQRLRGALGDPAVLLAADEQRVEDPPAVVDRDVAQQLDLAGLGVDLDERDVATERERGVGPVEVELVGEPGFHVGRATRVVAGRLGQVGPRRARWPARRRRGGRRCRRRCRRRSPRAGARRVAWPCRAPSRWRCAPRIRPSATTASPSCRHRVGCRRCRTARS